MSKQSSVGLDEIDGGLDGEADGEADGVADFVGEIIPIVNTNTKKAVAVITEGAIFQAYLSKQNQTVDVEKR